MATHASCWLLMTLSGEHTELIITLHSNSQFLRVWFPMIIKIKTKSNQYGWRFFICYICHHSFSSLSNDYFSNGRIPCLTLLFFLLNYKERLKKHFSHSFRCLIEWHVSKHFIFNQIDNERVFLTWTWRDLYRFAFGCAIPRSSESDIMQTYLNNPFDQINDLEIYSNLWCKFHYLFFYWYLQFYRTKHDIQIFVGSFTIWMLV